MRSFPSVCAIKLGEYPFSYSLSVYDNIYKSCIILKKCIDVVEETFHL